MSSFFNTNFDIIVVIGECRQCQ